MNELQFGEVNLYDALKCFIFYIINLKREFNVNKKCILFYLLNFFYLSCISHHKIMLKSVLYFFIEFFDSFNCILNFYFCVIILFARKSCAFSDCPINSPIFKHYSCSNEIFPM